MSFVCDELSIRNCGKYLSMKDTGRVTKNLTLIFFLLLWVICRVSINIRIGLHLFAFALRNERTLVACKSCDARSDSKRFTRD